MRDIARLVLVGLLLTLPAIGVQAAEEDSVATDWQTSLVVDLTATQTSYSNSWVGGEAGSFSWVSNLNGSAEKQLAEWMDFKSTLRLSFGQTLTQNSDSANSWQKPKKSTDLIDWDNVGRFTMHMYVDPYAAFRLESQFVDASVDGKDRYFSPLRLTQSAGVARQFYKKDKDVVFSRLGFALRQTFKTSIIDTVNLITDDSTITDGGLELVTDVTKQLSDKLHYVGKLTVYKAFFSSTSDETDGTEFEDYWKAIDINWENTVNAKLSKIITVNFYTQFLYDKEITKKGRFKQTLGIGFVFTML